MLRNGTTWTPWASKLNLQDQNERLPGFNDDKRRKRKLTQRKPSWRRLLCIVAAVVALFFFVFWRRHEVHIEIQTYSRGWIARKITPVDALTSQCFNPRTIASTLYPVELRDVPKHVQLHAGLGMTLGDDCFNFASTVPDQLLPGMQVPERTVFHLYWRMDLLPIGDRQVMLLDSILAMQDPARTSAVLWTNDASEATLHRQSAKLQPIKERYGERFAIKQVNKAELAKGTAMEGHSMLQMVDDKAWLDGDLVRLLVVWTFGGVWVDMDTILTGRSMLPLLESEWVTQWDCYGKSQLRLRRSMRTHSLVTLPDKVYQPLNGAMMHFFINSPFVCEMLHGMAHGETPKPGTVDWGSRLYHRAWRRIVAAGIKPFSILPYCFTDGRSCRLDNRLPDPFELPKSNWGAGRMEALDHKLRQVFAVHLHNQWARTFPPGGWVQKLLRPRIDAAVAAYRL
ncbi:hypothetical protein OIV83_006260 [Microbotryomycetes sp. JL201]|nr:hypothetical protein OIV83_006260 [Microbotryomycetes sp. JL201]